MLLCLDIGNSHIFGGVFASNNLVLRFRHNTAHGATSDQFGIFLKNVLKENQVKVADVRNIAICSVVPSIDYSIRAACKKYFDLEPFILRTGVKTGIKIKTNNPAEVGTDLIAGAIAASYHYPRDNVIITDLGTATTLVALSNNKEFLGTTILPGMRVAMDSLHSNAEKLHPVEIAKPVKAIGKFTTESIQSGLYYGHLGALKEIVGLIIKENFASKAPVLIGTGGFAHLFATEKFFDTIISDLVLNGLRLVFNLNEV